MASNGNGTAEPAPSAPLTQPAQAPAAGVWDKLKSMLPDTSNIYLQPLDPSSDMSFSDRLSLIWQSARPVGEFLDISNFNLPPMEQVRSRIAHNVETYFYNYFLLACLHLLLFSLVHFGAVFALVCWLALVYVLYIVRKDDIDVAGKFTIDSNCKLFLTVVTGLLALFVGHVLTLVISLAIFILIVVGIHSIIREDTADSTAMDLAI